MKIRQIGAVVLAAMVVAACSVPGTPQQAASPSGAATMALVQAEVVQATTARTAAAETPTTTPTTSASASASASAKPSATTSPSVAPNLGARGRGSKGGASTPTPKPGTTAPPQPTAKPGTAAPTATPKPGTPQPTSKPGTPQPTTIPTLAPAPTDTPTEVVINFLSSVQVALNTPQNTQYFSSVLAQRVANGETVGSLLNVGDDPGNMYIDFSVDDALVGSSGIAGVNATLIYNNAFVKRVFQLVDEGDGWKIDSITDITPFQPPLNPEPPIEEPTPTPTSEVVAAPTVVQPIDVVQYYIQSLVADPSGASSGQYWLPGSGSPTLEEVAGPGLLINYAGDPLDDGLGSTAAVQYIFSTDESNYVRTFELVRQGQVWFISAIY